MNQVKVTGEPGKLRSQILVGRHRLVADVDVPSGGEDAGPSPHDYLAAALGTCSATTVKMYAKRKGWALENVEVVVTLEEVGGTTMFDRKIRLVGNLPEEQKKRLLEIANHCPIHKALSGKIEITTSLTE